MDYLNFWIFFRLVDSPQLNFCQVLVEVERDMSSPEEIPFHLILSDWLSNSYDVSKEREIQFCVFFFFFFFFFFFLSLCFNLSSFFPLLVFFFFQFFSLPFPPPSTPFPQTPSPFSKTELFD